MIVRNFRKQLSLLLIAISLVILSTQAHAGAGWTGTFINKSSVPITISYVTNWCWYPNALGDTTVIPAGSQVVLYSETKTSGFNCNLLATNSWGQWYTITPKDGSANSSSLDLYFTGTGLDWSWTCALSFTLPLQPPVPNEIGCSPVTSTAGLVNLTPYWRSESW